MTGRRKVKPTRLTEEDILALAEMIDQRFQRHREVLDETFRTINPVALAETLNERLLRHREALDEMFRAAVPTINAVLDLARFNLPGRSKVRMFVRGRNVFMRTSATPPFIPADG